MTVQNNEHPVVPQFEKFVIPAHAGILVVTVQVVQVMLRWAGLLRPRCAEGGVMVQAYPCTLPGMRQSYTSGHVDAVV